MSCPPTPWHRLFGIALTDLFIGRPWRVELELELALKSQRLDVLFIERQPGQTALWDSAALADLPDGLDNLGAHNILTYKSAQESLDAWAMEELIGHYVTYRKLVSQSPAATRASADPACDADPTPARGRLLPADDFRLYAVTTRPPGGLLRQLHPSAHHPTAWPGVSDLTWGHRTIRLIVRNTIADPPRNAPWARFASELARVRSGLNHDPPSAPLARLLRNHRAQAHQRALPDMAYTRDDCKHATWRLMSDDVVSFTAEDRAALLARMAIEDRLRGLPPEDRRRGLDPDQPPSTSPPPPPWPPGWPGSEAKGEPLGSIGRNGAGQSTLPAAPSRGYQDAPGYWPRGASALLRPPGQTPVPDRTLAVSGG